MRSRFISYFNGQMHELSPKLIIQVVCSSSIQNTAFHSGADLLIDLGNTFHCDITELNVIYVSSSTLVRSWFTPTLCIVYVPSLLSAGSPPSSSLWPAVSLDFRLKDHSPRLTCPQRRRPLVILKFG